MLLTFDEYRMKQERWNLCWKTQIRLQRFWWPAPCAGQANASPPPLSYLYNSITYRHINANRIQAGVWACAQNDRRDTRIRFVRKLYAIKKWTQGVLTRFIPVSFVLLKTFFKKQCRRGTDFFRKGCPARIFVPDAFDFRDESNGQDQLLILPTGFRL